jgi:hypothetical protein
MTIHIPDWVFWLLGGIGGLLLIILAVLGVVFIGLAAKMGEGFSRW